MSRSLKLIAAVLLGFAATFVVGRVIVDDGESMTSAVVPVESSFPAIDHDPAAASALVHAWRTWRIATFVVRGTWTRTLDSGGSPLSGPVYSVQDPPRRLVQRLGATVELFDDQIASCEPPAQDDSGSGPAIDLSVGAAPCVSGRAGMSYDERVAAELAAVVEYVTGSSRSYDVDYGLIDGCFRAELGVAALGSPWGRWVEFCFDRDSGALLSSRVRRQSAVDVETNAVVSTEVADSDFTASP